MPDFGALSNLTGSLHGMGTSRKKKQAQDLCDKLGVDMQAGDEDMAADDLT